MERGVALRTFSGAKAEKMFSMLAIPAIRDHRRTELAGYSLKYVVEYETAYRFLFVRKGRSSVEFVQEKPKN